MEYSKCTICDSGELEYNYSSIGDYQPSLFPGMEAMHIIELTEKLICNRCGHLIHYQIRRYRKGNKNGKTGNENQLEIKKPGSRTQEKIREACQAKKDEIRRADPGYQEFLKKEKKKKPKKAAGRKGGKAARRQSRA